MDYITIIIDISNNIIYTYKSVRLFIIFKFIFWQLSSNCDDINDINLHVDK